MPRHRSFTKRCHHHRHIPMLRMSAVRYLHHLSITSINMFHHLIGYQLVRLVPVQVLMMLISTQYLRASQVQSLNSDQKRLGLMKKRVHGWLLVHQDLGRTSSHPPSMLLYHLLRNTCDHSHQQWSCYITCMNCRPNQQFHRYHERLKVAVTN